MAEVHPGYTISYSVKHMHELPCYCSRLSAAHDGLLSPLSPAASYESADTSLCGEALTQPLLPQL